MYYKKFESSHSAELLGPSGDVIYSVRSEESTNSEPFEAETISPAKEDFAHTVGDIALSDSVEVPSQLTSDIEPAEHSGGSKYNEEANAHIVAPEAIEAINRNLRDLTVNIDSQPKTEATKSVDQKRHEETVDSVFKNSRSINFLDRLNTAKQEKEWRSNVRELNGAEAKQKIRSEKANYRRTKALYGRMGRAELRHNELVRLKEEMNKRRSEGRISGMQSLMARRGLRKAAKEYANNLADERINQAKDSLSEAKDNRDILMSRYGRRNNSLRKNYQRVNARLAQNSSYPRIGDYLSTPKPSLSELWNSEEYKKKREEALKMREERQKAERRKAGKSRNKASSQNKSKS